MVTIHFHLEATVRQATFLLWLQTGYVSLKVDQPVGDFKESFWTFTQTLIFQEQLLHAGERLFLLMCCWLQPM